MTPAVLQRSHRRGLLLLPACGVPALSEVQATAHTGERDEAQQERTCQQPIDEDGQPTPHAQ